MIALQLLPLLQLIIIFYAPRTMSMSYLNPSYSAKRYGRSNQRLSYEPYPVVASHHYPVNYYKLYPYSQSSPDDYYYPQESYPMYYPPKTSKFDAYQAAMPYYYQDAVMSRPGYGYYGYNDPASPSLDWQEEMIQQAEREEREESQPIGHESFYENDEGSSSPDPSFSDTNAAFLQNLILSQMYQDSLDNDKESYQNYNRDYDDAYGKFEDVPEQPVYPSEDETVRELKQLQKENENRQFRKQSKNNNDVHWSQNPDNKKKQRNNRKNKEENKRDSFKGTVVYSDRKPVVKLATSPPVTTEENTRDSRGQKEEFQMRPATPVRHPFASPVLAMMANSETERKRAPSVYDTIKHMLDMEKSLENNPADSDPRPAMKKRIITPEENLTRQLSVLKKTQ